MSVTQAEVLNLFQHDSSVQVSDSDLFLLSKDQGGTAQARKITAEVVRAYLNAGYAVTIVDGYLYIGGQNTGYRAAGITPQLRSATLGIEVSYDNGSTWTLLCQWSNLNLEPYRVSQTLSTVTIFPNRLNVWASGQTSMTITLGSGSEGREQEYKLQFVVSGNAFSLTFPGSDIRWMGGEEPEWEDGYTYQVSIIDGLAVYGGWAPEAEES